MYQNIEALLREVMVVGQYIPDSLFAHDVHRDAISQTVLLIVSTLVKRESFKKGEMRLRQNHDGFVLL
jgi:hypothetical protein